MFFRAKTNNFTKETIYQNGYIKRIIGYIIPYNEKGMGSADDNDSITWEPKKPEDKRFMGKPGEVKESVDRKGEKRLTKIGKNGYATKERHCGNHSYPNKHSSPHDHDIDWQNNRPNLSKPINYETGDAPEFKLYGDDSMSNKKLDCDGFKSLAEFKDTLLYGKEIVFRWNGIEYGVFYDNTIISENFSFCEKEKEYKFNNFDDLASHSIHGFQLKDIIAEAEVILRNV